MAKVDLSHLVSSDSDENLKCYVCNSYLSHFPIFLCSNDESLCGRCTPPEDVSCYRNQAFETLCQSVEFPCRYHLEGCSEELLPEEVPQHERTCPFRRVECVGTKSEPCDWSGPLPALLQHCRAVHADVFLRDAEFVMDVSRSEERDYFLECDDRLIFFTKKFDCKNKKLSYSLSSNEDRVLGGGTSVDLTLKFGKMSLSHKVAVTSYDSKTFTELFLHRFCSLMNNENLILGKIGMGEVQNVGDECRENLQDTISRIFSRLKCGCCGDLATPPIFRTSDDLLIMCSRCAYYKRAEYDSRGIEILTDDVLCEILTLINSECPNAKKGCTYSAKYLEMRTHYRFCKYAEEKCFLQDSCQWKGLVKDTGDHILVDHMDLLHPSGLEIEMTFQDNDETKYKVIQIGSHLFKLSYKAITNYIDYRENKYQLMWSVQMMGNYNEEFIYQIEAGDKKSGGKLSLWQLCTQITENESIFFNPSDYCCLEEEQLLRALNTLEFALKVNIFKVKIYK